jgi:hypothetical protein
MNAGKQVRFDYIKVLFRQDHDHFQADTLPTLNGVISWTDEVGMLRTCSNLTVLPSKPGETSRYIFEVWGPMADRFAMYMPATWWECLRRIDLRAELNDLDPNQMRDAVRYLAHRESKHNVSLFDSKPRAKRGENRDVGGIGMYWGSRKSGQHGVIYKRGNEAPAAEYRLRDKSAQEFGHLVTEQCKSNNQPCGAAYALIDMQHMAAAFWGSRISGELDRTLEGAAKQGALLNKVAQQMGLFDETEAERNYWASLSTEEQLDLSRQTWEPTLQGWKDTAGRADLRAGTPAEPSDDDDLPF